MLICKRISFRIYKILFSTLFVFTLFNYSLIHLRCLSLGQLLGLLFSIFFLATEEDYEFITDDEKIMDAKKILKAVEDEDSFKLEKLLSRTCKSHLSKPLNKLNQTIIHLAVMFASADIFGILIKRADQTSTTWSSGMTPLHYASRVGSKNFQACLSSWPETINSLCLERNMSPLMYTLEKKLLHESQQLLASPKIDISLRDNKGENVLFYVAHHFKETEAKKLFFEILKNENFTSKMVFVKNNQDCSAIELIAENNLIETLLMIGRSNVFLSSLFNTNFYWPTLLIDPI